MFVHTQIKFRILKTLSKLRLEPHSAQLSSACSVSLPMYTGLGLSTYFVLYVAISGHLVDALVYTVWPETLN